jgi:hypothetical protein
MIKNQQKFLSKKKQQLKKIIIPIDFSSPYTELSSIITFLNY